MKSVFEKIWIYGNELFFAPERFREILVMLFTGVGEEPHDLAHLFIAWLMAVALAHWLFPKK